MVGNSVIIFRIISVTWARMERWGGMNSNSDNPKVGKTFQLVVKEWFEQARKVSYQMEKAIPKQVGKFSRHK